MPTIETTNPTLRIPRSRASRAFLEIARNVYRHPILSGTSGIRSWVVPGWDMALPEAAFNPEFVVTTPLCPLLVMWPEPRNGQPLTNAQQQATLNITIRLFLATVDPLDCLDYFAAVWDAVSPDTVVEGQALRARLHVITGWSGSIDIDQPGVVAYPYTDGGAVMMAEGSVSTRFRIESF